MILPLLLLPRMSAMRGKGSFYYKSKKALDKKYKY